MNILFFILLSFFLFVLQTILLPSFSWFSQCFDLLIILVLYLSLLSGRQAVILPIVLIGAVMDSTSGVPFFLHIFSYLWVYLIVRMVRQFFFQRSLIFILMISIVSVAIQQCLVILSILMQHGVPAVLELNFGLMVRQVFWGLLFIGPGLWLVNVARVNWLAVASAVKKQITQHNRGQF
jgi:rod shape-determining protein MreD